MKTSFIHLNESDFFNTAIFLRKVASLSKLRQTSFNKTNEICMQIKSNQIKSNQAARIMLNVLLLRICFATIDF